MNDFFVEIRRRKVGRVVVGYAIVAWLVAQVADLAADNFGAPGWFMPMLLVLLALGLPFAAVLAWAYETTPDGVRREDGGVPVRGLAATRGGWLALVAVLAAIALAAVSFPAWRGIVGAGDAATEGEEVPEAAATSPGDASATAVPAQSVAVLPFADMSENGDQAWFADGLTEEILNSLAALPELKVTSRTSSFRFRGDTRDIRAIADTLGVAHIVEGSVRRFGDELVVTAQLIRAVDGSHLMSETYERPADDLFSVQRDVAERVAATLDVFLDEEKRERMFASGTRSVEAFEAFLHGQERLNAWHAEGSGVVPFDSVTQPFERAMALDPGYAEAALEHMDLFAHVLLDGTESDFTPEEARAQLQHDLEFAATHAASEEARLVAELNRIWLSSDWHRLPGIVEQLGRAIDAGGRPPRGAGWTSIILALADPELARRLGALELEANPLDPVAWSVVAGAELRAGNTDRVLDIVRQARRRVDDHPYLREDEIAANANAGRRDSLLAALRRYPWDNPVVAAWRAAVAGDERTARRIAAELEARDWPEERLLFTYRELGDRAAASDLAGRVDALRLGHAILYRMVSLTGSVPFDLADTPNFRARLAEAGIDLSGLGDESGRF
ncbi:MAG TPA: hypothetical protein VLA33_00180 [Gemmatimonadota bacterium]|nr:hypothetical protein [Gemmatimonadota bacterium]